MRKRNILLGTIFGILYQIISILLSFAVRTFFLQNLSIDYLGINALFSDIFGILIALDCGISSSVFIRIYKPLAEDNQEKVKSVFALVRFVYRVRAVAVFIIGGVIYFFLPILANSEKIEMGYIQKCYIAYLILTSLNYTIVFYTFFLETIQKRFLLVIIQGIVQLFQSMCSILCLIVLKNYMIYMMINLLAEIIKGIISRGVGLYYYPYLKGKITIEKEDKKDFVNLVGMAFHSMSSVVIRYTDSLLITGLAGLSINGLYSNYKMLIDRVGNLINQLTSSVKDPMRSLMAEGDKDYVSSIMKRMNFLYFWVSGFCAVCIFVLINPFIELVWGRQYILDNITVLLSVIILYLPILSYSINDAYYYSECYMHDKKTPIMEIMINLFLSFLLGKIIGLKGILIGTVACYVFQTIRRAFRLYHKYFEKSVKEYLYHWVIYNMTIFLTGFICYFLCNYLKINNQWINFLLKGIVCIFVPNIIFYLLFFKTEGFRYFMLIFQEFINKIFWKRK